MSPHVATAVAELRDLSVNQLAGRYEAVFDEPCRSRNKQYLLRRIAWRLQANDEGGLSPTALKRAAQLAAGADVRVTAPRATSSVATVKQEVSFKDWDPRLPPPQSLLEREHKGRTIRVVVLRDGFLYEGQHYGSLSAVAKAVTGAQLQRLPVLQTWREPGMSGRGNRTPTEIRWRMSSTRTCHARFRSKKSETRCERFRRSIRPSIELVA